MAEQPQPQAEAPKSSLFGKIIIAVFMATVILTECILAYVLIPDADEVARLAEARMTEKLQANINPNGVGDDKKTVEFALGNYSVTFQHSESNTTLRMDFQLFGTVLEDDQSDLEQQFERVKQRLRDRVTFEIRNSNMNDLTDPGLALIKRRILEKSNGLMGTPIIQSILITEFSLVEQ